MNRKSYPTDLTDEQRNITESFIPSDALTGRPRRLSLREITDAVLYIVRAGCARSLLPHDFPAWQSVYYYFNKRKKTVHGNGYTIICSVKSGYVRGGRVSDMTAEKI